MLDGYGKILRTLKSFSQLLRLRSQRLRNLNIQLLKLLIIFKLSYNLGQDSLLRLRKERQLLDLAIQQQEFLLLHFFTLHLHQYIQSFMP